MCFDLATGSTEETETVGEDWGRVLEPGDVLLLSGELGSGKTTLVRGLARGLGVLHPVKSPSFALLLSYPGRHPLHHLDLYRIEAARDLEELGLDDVLGREGVTVIEWGERLGAFAPSWAVRITLSETGRQGRRLAVAGPSSPVRRLAAASPGAPGPGGRT